MSGNQEEDVYLAVQGFTFLERDPVTGTEKFFRTEPDGRTTIYVRQDVTELLKVNHELFQETKNQKLGDWVQLARYDEISSQKLGLDRALKEGDRKHIKKVLNDGEYRKFRTSNLAV